MNDLKHAIYSIAVIAVICGILDFFSQSESLKKYVKYATSLIITFMMLYPLNSILQDLPADVSIPPFDSPDLQQTANNHLTQAFNSSISDKLTMVFEIPKDACEIQTTVLETDNQILIDQIQVNIVQKKYFRYAERIESFLKSNFGCDVKVTQLFKEK